MPGADYSLRIIVDADDRATRTLDGLRGVLGDLGGHFRTLGTVALGGLGMLAGAATGAGVAIARLAVDAAPLDDVRAAFAGLAKSAGVGADEMLDALERGSEGMISHRDLMLSFNRAAQLVSKDFAVQLPDAMRYLSKVAAATGQDMNYMLSSLVTGVGRLSPLILDNLGIQVSLTEATEEAARMYGVKASELSKAQLQAGMMSVVLKRLRDNTAAMPDTTGTAATSLAQLRAAFQNAKDAIGLQFVPALSELLNAIAPLAREVLPVVASILREHIVPAVQAVVTAFSAFVNALRSGQSLMDAMRAALATLLPPELLEQFDELRAAIESVISVARPYLRQLVAWISENVKLQDVLIALAVAIAAVVVPAIVLIVKVVTPIAALFLATVAAVAALRTAWESNFLGIRDITLAVIEIVRFVIVNATAFIRNLWQQHGNDVIAIVRMTWDGIRTIVSTVVGVIQSIIAAFQAAVRGDWSAFGEHLRVAWDRAWSLISEALRSWSNVLRNNISSLISSIVLLFRNTDWATVGRNIIEGIISGVSAATSGLINALIWAIRNALNAVRAFLGIRSPSTVFQKIGQQMMAGWARGVEMSARLPALRTREVASGTVSAVAAGRGVTIQTVVVYADEPETLLRRLQAYA